MIQYKVMIIGDAPSRVEHLSGEPFLGNSGKEFTSMLHEAGFIRTECFLTNVCPIPAPQGDAKNFFTKDTKAVRLANADLEKGIKKLKQDIAQVNPDLIIALGEIPLWVLTGEKGITKWRGSILESTNLNNDFEFQTIYQGLHGHQPPKYFKVIPTFRPSDIMKQWSWRFIMVQDLRRAKKESVSAEIAYPNYQFIIRPSFEQVMTTIQNLRSVANGDAVWDGFDMASGNTYPHVIPAHNGSTEASSLVLTGDIETSKGHIACIGIGWSKTEAICIPFTSVNNRDGYWTEPEEQAIVWELIQLFRHPKIKWRFQNGLYDFQYFAHRWGSIPTLDMDTMLAQHVCFAGLQKGLDFQSSIYCEYHRYWKDEGKEYHEGMKTMEEENKYWTYNCKDCVTTYEISLVHEATIQKLHMQEPYEFQMRQFRPVLNMMLRGVRIDTARKAELSLELLEAIADRERWINDVVGHPVNFRSPKQMKELFYGELGLPEQRNRKSGTATTNDEALKTLAKKEPLVAPLVKVFGELRSLGVFLSTFVSAKTSEDGRMRSSYNIAGTETFRWSSSTDAFGTGMNLQNIPKGTEK